MAIRYGEPRPISGAMEDERCLFLKSIREDIARVNRIYLNERAYPFSESNIDDAVRRLIDRVPEGVVRANERMTDDLTLGIALPQTIGATSREWPFVFIDWKDWRANSFQVTSEYTVSEPGGSAIAST